MPKTTRKFPTEKKTTTKEGKREYQRLYMRDYRTRFKKLQEKVRMAKKMGLLPEFTYEVI